MNTTLSPKITGLVITLNEEKNIQSVIENLNFVDELIVVDSFSTDKTTDIIKNYPHVKLVQNVFENYTAQRNLALSFASNEWVLFLDADERIPQALKDEICSTVKNPEACDAYYFFRKFFFKDKPLHFSGLQTDKNIRLFKKDKGYYIPDRLVHEILKVEGSKGILKNKLIHYSYSDYNSYKSKMIYYAHLKAKEMFQKNLKPSFFIFWIKAIYKFFLKYFIRLGILDGKKGIIVCYLNALSIYKRYPELVLLYKNKL